MLAYLSAVPPHLEGPPASLAGLLLACGVTGLHPAIGPDKQLALTEH